RAAGPQRRRPPAPRPPRRGLGRGVRRRQADRPPLLAPRRITIWYTEDGTLVCQRNGSRPSTGSGCRRNATKGMLSLSKHVTPPSAAPDTDPPSTPARPEALEGRTLDGAPTEAPRLDQLRSLLADRWLIVFVAIAFTLRLGW